jgi:hypothetical protein
MCRRNTTLRSCGDRTRYLLGLLPLTVTRRQVTVARRQVMVARRQVTVARRQVTVARKPVSVGRRQVTLRGGKSSLRGSRSSSRKSRSSSRGDQSRSRGGNSSSRVDSWQESGDLTQGRETLRTAAEGRSAEGEPPLRWGHCADRYGPAQMRTRRPRSQDKDA